MQEVLVRTNRVHSFDNTRAAYKTFPTLSLCREKAFTEPLPSNDRATHSPFQSSKLLLVLTNTVILGSESHGTHDHILLSHSSESLHTTASVIHRQTHRLIFGKTRTYKTTRSTVLLFLLVFVATGTCLMSRCLATKVGYRYRHKDLWEGFMSSTLSWVQMFS
jgi:hypothetical protein